MLAMCRTFIGSIVTAHINVSNVNVDGTMTREDLIA